MSKHLFSFVRGDTVSIVGGTYMKPHPVLATVTKDVLARSTFVPIEFADPQVGNSAIQKLRGPVRTTRVAKSNLEIVDPPQAEAEYANDDIAPAGTANVTEDDVSSVSSEGVLNSLNALDLKDARISNELRVRIRDLCDCLKREGLHRNCPAIPALTTLGLNEVQHWD